MTIDNTVEGDIKSKGVKQVIGGQIGQPKYDSNSCTNKGGRATRSQELNANKPEYDPITDHSGDRDSY